MPPDDDLHPLPSGADISDAYLRSVWEAAVALIAGEDGEAGAAAETPYTSLDDQIAAVASLGGSV